MARRLGSFDHRQLQLLEKYFSDLLGRIEIEGLACFAVRARLQLEHARAQLVALRLEQRRVDQHSLALHPE